jgi:hypothetical protein
VIIDLSVVKTLDGSCMFRSEFDCLSPNLLSFSLPFPCPVLASHECLFTDKI